MSIHEDEMAYPNHSQPRMECPYSACTVDLIHRHGTDAEYLSRVEEQTRTGTFEEAIWEAFKAGASRGSAHPFGSEGMRRSFDQWREEHF